MRLKFKECDYNCESKQVRTRSGGASYRVYCRRMDKECQPGYEKTTARKEAPLGSTTYDATLVYNFLATSHFRDGVHWRVIADITEGTQLAQVRSVIHELASKRFININSLTGAVGIRTSAPLPEAKKKLRTIHLWMRRKPKEHLYVSERQLPRYEKLVREGKATLLRVLNVASTDHARALVDAYAKGLRVPEPSNIFRVEG